MRLWDSPRLYNVLLLLAIAGVGLVMALYATAAPGYAIHIRYEPQAAQAPPTVEDEAIQAEDALPKAALHAEPEMADADDLAEAWVVYFPLDLNRATEEELALVPAIGDVTARRIVQYRQWLGGYSSLEQLMEIRGIGEKTWQTIAPYLFVEE
ncbi:helix-hairpin-helix domain-containing protein [Ruminococcaceae bacterium OttesenSCG-928-L11]|nr:helix-hairpin-helix domain-containing protein [Ruminococcaceae bacterium OttesenSCG-928-L11]